MYFGYAKPLSIIGIMKGDLGFRPKLEWSCRISGKKSLHYSAGMETLRLRSGWRWRQVLYITTYGLPVFVLYWTLQGLDSNVLDFRLVGHKVRALLCYPNWPRRTESDGAFNESRTNVNDIVGQGRKDCKGDVVASLYALNPYHEFHPLPRPPIKVEGTNRLSIAGMCVRLTW